MNAFFPLHIASGESLKPAASTWLLRGMTKARKARRMRGIEMDDLMLADFCLAWWRTVEWRGLGVEKVHLKMRR